MLKMPAWFLLDITFYYYAAIQDAGVLCGSKQISRGSSKSKGASITNAWITGDTGETPNVLSSWADPPT